jgi:hypothetical protein
MPGRGDGRRGRAFQIPLSTLRRTRGLRSGRSRASGLELRDSGPRPRTPSDLQQCSGRRLKSARPYFAGARHYWRKVRHDGRKVRHSGRKVRHSGRKVRHNGREVRHDGREVRHRGRKVRHRGRKVRHDGREVRHDGREVRHRGRKVCYDGREDRHDGRKDRHNGRIGFQERQATAVTRCGVGLLRCPCIAALATGAYRRYREPPRNQSACFGGLAQRDDRLFQSRRRQTRSQRKNGPPSSAVRMPTGSSAGAITVRAPASQRVRKAPPPRRQAGTRNR